MQLEPLHVRGMGGLGDNIYLRPFIRAAAEKYEIWLNTPWPELFADLDIKYMRHPLNLRTQQKNMARQPASRWSRLSQRMQQLTTGYPDLANSSIIKLFEQQWAALQVPFKPAFFDLPDMGPAPVISDRPIAVVRPITIRKEWRNAARNPRPEYLAQIVSELMVTHHVVAVADIAPGQEMLVGQLPPAHQQFIHGELPVRQLLALIRDADVVVGGVGWIVPAGLAFKVKTFAVLGGHGGHNAPEKITDPRLDLGRIGFAMPEKFCQCTSKFCTNCDKTIADPLGQFFRWRHSLRAAA